MEAEAVIRLIVALVPEIAHGVAALFDALDSGKTEAEALAAARAHLPARIDTTAEDAARRARLTKVAAAHGLDESTMRVLVAPQVASSVTRVRLLAESIVLSHEDREALRVVVEHVEHVERLRRSDEPTGRTPLTGPDR